jgi:hypothetical protein
MTRTDLLPLAQRYRLGHTTLPRAEAWAVADVLVLTAQALATAGHASSAFWRAQASARRRTLTPHVRDHLAALLGQIKELAP